MTEPVPERIEAGAVPPNVPPRLPEGLRSAQLGYHRMLLALAIVVLTACFLLPAPGTSGELRLPGLDKPLPALCMLKRQYGLDCPGCGLTRCFLSVSHARLAAAWAFHPAGVLLFAALVAQIPYRAYQLWRLRQGHAALNHWTLRWILWLLIATILGQWILRMTGVLY